MRSEDIKSDRVRLLISGSPTPAQDILALPGLTFEERKEANDYFSYCGGLNHAAYAEGQFVEQHGI